MGVHPDELVGSGDIGVDGFQGGVADQGGVPAEAAGVGVRPGDGGVGGGGVGGARVLGRDGGVGGGGVVGAGVLGRYGGVGGGGVGGARVLGRDGGVSGGGVGGARILFKVFNLYFKVFKNFKKSFQKRFQAFQFLPVESEQNKKSCGVGGKRFLLHKQRAYI